MDIVQFLNVLLFRSDVKIVRPGLPECGRQPLTENGQLLFRGSFLRAALERNALLQHLHDPGTDLRFWVRQSGDGCARASLRNRLPQTDTFACLLKHSQKDVTVPG